MARLRGRSRAGGAAAPTRASAALHASYGTGFQASDDSLHAVECELVDDDDHEGSFLDGISAAFYGPLQGLEIALRNAIYQQLIRR